MTLWQKNIDISTVVLLAIPIQMASCYLGFSCFDECFVDRLSSQSKVGVLNERLPTFNGQLTIPPCQDSQR